MTLTALRKPAIIEISNIKVEQGDGVSLASAVVDGTRVWYESDVNLALSPEAFACAFFLPSLNMGKALKIKGAMTSKFIENIQKANELVTSWWGYPSLSLIPDGLEVIDGGIGEGTGEAAIANSFSGGIDSFYTLLRGTTKPEFLVFVRGFDMPHDDEVRARECEVTLDEVAAEFSIKPLVVKTNLRDHPHVKKCPWDNAHGAALASVGHVLSPHISKFVIPPAWSYEYDSPYGTHWRLDPLWSSEDVEIVPGDPSLWRQDRIASIANEELVAKHLRVCWANSTPTGNCSRCSKCIRTMIVLHSLGVLHKYTVFDTTVNFQERIDEIRHLSADSIVIFQRLLTLDLDKSVEKAISKLISRSRFRLQVRKLFGMG